MLAVVSFLLAIPAVQTSLGKSATNYLKKEFDVDINVKKIDLSVLGNVKLKEILINNHHADTLIYVKNLTTSVFSYRNILNNKLEFGKVLLDDFMLNMKTYEGEDTDALTIFIDKFDDGKSTDEPSGFLLTSANLKLKNGYVEIFDVNKDEGKPLFFDAINGNAQNFKISGPNVSTEIRDLSFIENHAIKVEKLNSNFLYSNTLMNFSETELITETSKLNANIAFHYQKEDLADFNNKVQIEAEIKDSDLSLTDLNKLYNEFGIDDVLHFSTKINGTLNDFKAENLKLYSDKQALIFGDINFKNSFNTESGFSLDGNFINLTSDYYQLKSLLPNILGNTLPSIFEKFGRFTLSGITHIEENFIDANLNLNTNIGNAKSNLQLTNINNIDAASYKGHIDVTDFELGEILNDPLVGKFSIEADVNGKGFTLEKMNTSVKGKISKIEYKNYQYNNIAVNGIVKNKNFNGEMEVNDDNIKLNFNGLADLSAEIYKFDFKATVDYCDLNKINWFKRDSISNLKGDVYINLKGNSLDDLVGTLDFKNTLYANQKDNYFFKDFNITSAFEDSIRTITINSSEIIDGRIRGKFKFNELGKLTQNSIGSLYSNYKPYPVTPGQSLDFRFKIYNKIVEVVYPDVTLSANTTIRGNISSDDGLFRLNVKSPQVTAFQNIIEDLNVQIDNKNPLFNTQLTVEKLTNKYYDISSLKLVNITLNDTLYVRTEFKGGTNQTEDYNLAFYHTFNNENKSVFGIQKSNFTFKNNQWVINPTNNFDNKVVIDSKAKVYDFSPFIIQSKEQKIAFSGQINDTISKDLKFDFKNVKLSSITPEIDSLKFNGLLNGSLNYNQVQKQLKPTANFTINDFKVNNSYQGNLKVQVEGKNSLKNYSVHVSLEREGYENLFANGDLDFTSNKPTIDLNVEFNEFKLDAFSPLGGDVISKIRGFAYGNVQLTGLLSNPTMEGDLFLDQAGMYIPYLNVDYNFEGTSVISLKDQEFIIEDVLLSDKMNQTKGKLTGSISHHNFEEWFLDLDINTRNLLVLNTEEEENSLYYGQAFLEGTASIYGPTDKLFIDVVGSTKKGTYFVIPISDVKTVEANQLIRFVGENEAEDKEEIRRAILSDKLKGLSLNFNIDVTKDAVVEMVLDKATGSYLRGSGTGNLQIELDTKDKFNMYGDFIVDNGIYNFKYGGIISKPFTVRKGGSISWSGNPYTADINIEAVYRVSANPRSLLENITANRKIPIDLITRFSGELFNSKREFDIFIPNSSSTVASELEFKLNNNDQNIKTIHFMALLATGSFYNEGDLSVNSTGFISGTWTELLSNAFDNIFNQVDNRFKVKPVYTVGEKNRVDNVTIDDQLALALDYQVNDRILINGKVGVPIGSKQQSNVIGEVNIEFLMNEEGTLRSSVFNRQNEIQYTEEEEGYTQGVGLSYQIDFNTGGELLEKLGLKKKKEVDSLTTEKQLDSLNNTDKLLKFKNKKSNTNE